MSYGCQNKNLCKIIMKIPQARIIFIITVGIITYVAVLCALFAQDSTFVGKSGKSDNDSREHVRMFPSQQEFFRSR